jgi:predicted DNA-binding transcriptional regulator AlpA
MSTATANNQMLRVQPGNPPSNRYPLPPNLIGLAVENAPAGRQETGENATSSERDDDRLLNARQVAAKLGVSERWVRDHTTRRSPRIRGVKLGLLMRYRRADVDAFMAELDTLPSSRRPRFGV